MLYIDRLLLVLLQEQFDETSSVCSVSSKRAEEEERVYAEAIPK